MPALNFTVLTAKVEDGTKCQSIRRATEHSKKLFKVDKPINLYTGMRRRDYCKNKNSPRYGQYLVGLHDRRKGCTPLRGGQAFKYCTDCKAQGAKLLNQGVISEVLLIQYQYIKESGSGMWAEEDGFEDGYQPEICIKTCEVDSIPLHLRLCKGYPEIPSTCDPNDKLKSFLQKTYNAQPDDEFLIIQWKVDE